MNRKFIQNMSQEIIKWKNKYDCILGPPVNEKSIEELNKTIGPLPNDLVEFYKVTNGLKCDWFVIFPIEDPATIKKTWDGIKRANNVNTTKFLHSDTALLQQFLIFADIGAEKCAAFRKSDFTIWYQDEENLRQTDLDLKAFVNMMLLEVHSF